MFKSTRKRQKNQFNFEQQLNKQMNKLSQQIPIKNASNKKTKDIVNMLDEVIFELSTPKQLTPKKRIEDVTDKRQHQLEVEHIDTDQNSSISIHSKIDDALAGFQREKETIVMKDHISNLVSNHQIINFLKESYGLLGQNDRINLIDFIKKAYFFFLGISLREDEANILKIKVKNDLSTTDPDYVSLNALEIVSKRHILTQYFQEQYISMRIEIKIAQYQKRYKKLTIEINDRQMKLKERQKRLIIGEEEYEKNIIAQSNRQKLLQSKLKEINLREKQVRKSIEQKVVKLYEGYISNFGQKIKQVEKRLNNAQKNVKYKIQILQRRAEAIRTLINEKNDLKNKKQIGDNEAKIKLRKLQKQFQVTDKKHQAQLEVYQKQEKQLMKNISFLQEKITKHQKKMLKQKEKILELQDQLTQNKEKIDKLLVYNQQIQLKIQKLQQQSKQPKDPQLKIMKDTKQKTNRSQKNKKKGNNFNNSNLISLYEAVLQISQKEENISHISHQQLLSLLMKNTVSQLPQLIYILTSSEEEGNRQSEPHYLISTISSLIVKQFYQLNRDSQDSQNFLNQRMKSSQILQLLKYPYCLQIQLSFFLLFIQIFDWCENYPSRFFAKTLEHILQQIENHPKLGYDNPIVNHQIEIVTSKQCCFYLLSTYFTLLSHTINAEEKSSINLPSLLVILISLCDLMLFLIKNGDQSIFQMLIDCKTDELLINNMITSISCILKIYSSVEKGKQKVQSKVRTDLFDYIDQFEELSQKLSILIQRIFYKFQKARLSKIKIQKIQPIYKKLAELNESNGHRHSFIVANLKSIIEIERQSSI